MPVVKPWISKFYVFTIVSLSVLSHYLFKGFNKTRKKKGRKRPHRVFMIGAFYNSGWLQAHATPLVHSDSIDEVYIICDESIKFDIPNVSFECPSPLLARIIGRGPARIVTLLKAAYRLRPEIYMGYHIMPNSPLALLAASLFNGKSIYQMTGGPGQIIDGGYKSESPLLQALGKPSPFIESCLSKMIKCMDCIVVRGNNAKTYVNDRQLSDNCVIITGAIDTKLFAPSKNQSKEFDIITVSRLVSKFKGLERFLYVTKELTVKHLNFKAAIVGDGPAKQKLIKLAQNLEIDKNVAFLGKLNNVSSVLDRSKIFVLLSPSEGMSIAMLEAMSTGLPVVVTDVGELGDAVREIGSGFLVDYQSPKDVSLHILKFLNNEDYRADCAVAARQTVESNYSTAAIAKKWDQVFEQMFFSEIGTRK